jgi:outer membrane protein OmpA-like peptidoglycan-associated protein
MLTMALPVLTWAQDAEKKSAEEILDRLLGSDRGIGGVREEARPGKATAARIAVPIQFEFNSAQISPASAEQMGQIAQALRDPRLSTARVRVEGYTDNVGSGAYNLRLSQQRAEAVKRYLVEKEGIAAASLDAKGYGKSRPLAGVSQDDEDGRAANRRVELVNVGSAAVKVPAGRPKAAEAASALSVKVVVSYEKGGERRVLVADAVLTPEDNYRITFTPTQNSYVYVYQIDSQGKAAIVFPNAEYGSATNPVTAKRAYTVPPEGRWLKLDKQPGEEEILVLASTTELPDAEALAVRMRTPQFNTVTRGPAADTRADVLPEVPAGMFSYRLPFKHR